MGDREEQEAGEQPRFSGKIDEDKHVAEIRKIPETHENISLHVADLENLRDLIEKMIEKRDEK